MKRFIMMSCGFAEEAKTSWLIYQCDFSGHPGFPTDKEAITELALDLYYKFLGDKVQDPGLKTCCIASKTFNSQAKYCSNCGKSLADKIFEWYERLALEKKN